jgi:Cu-Zn family superoxide dismutase
MKKAIPSALFLILFSSAPLLAQEAPKHAAAKSVTVDIINAEGHSVGTAVLSESAHGVKITLNVKNLPPGPHLMHIHQFAKCEMPDFKSAGPHFNTPDGEHSHPGMMAGDIPNFVLTVGADGTAHATTTAPYVTLGSESNSVFSNGGTSIVIHAVAGEVSASAPPRIACGVITKAQ